MIPIGVPTSADLIVPFPTMGDCLDRPIRGIDLPLRIAYDIR
jgi:hypothetical protein